MVGGRFCSGERRLRGWGREESTGAPALHARGQTRGGATERPK